MTPFQVQTHTKSKYHRHIENDEHITQLLLIKLCGQLLEHTFAGMRLNQLSRSLHSFRQADMISKTTNKLSLVENIFSVFAWINQRRRQIFLSTLGAPQIPRQSNLSTHLPALPVVRTQSTAYLSILKYFPISISVSLFACFDTCPYHCRWS